MSTVDLSYLRRWIREPIIDRDTLTVRHARLMAATLGLEQDTLTEGTALPPLWHWLFFLEGFPPTQLGRDGHPARGGFLPPVPIENRMWAGGRVSFEVPLLLGAQVEKHSAITAVDHKLGRSGDLVFVTVLHRFIADGIPAITEEHDIVYRSAIRKSSDAAPQRREPAAIRRTVTPTSTMLFRYSALTFNGHRIHYDLDYCRNVEGYENLVIHGPLSATLLAGFAEEVSGSRLRHFTYRGIRPALLGTELTLNATVNGDRVETWTSLPDGSVSMQADAVIA